MKDNLSQQFLKQFDKVLELYKDICSRSKYGDHSNIPDTELKKIITMSSSAIERASGRTSQYTRQLEAILSRGGIYGKQLRSIIGIIEALRNDIAAGWLQSIEELVHGELFADFLEMATHLLEEGYKDAAAVIAGSTLEGHLRQLCVKNRIDTTTDGVKPKKADTMNAELTKGNVYSKLDQKNVTAWFDLRNKAAHGKYSEYAPEQVSLMISGIRDFITRVSA